MEDTVRKILDLASPTVRGAYYTANFIAVERTSGEIEVVKSRWGNVGVYTPEEFKEEILTYGPSVSTLEGFSPDTIHYYREKDFVTGKGPNVEVSSWHPSAPMGSSLPAVRAHGDRDGCFCESCGNFSHYAEPNLPGGRFRCFSCR